MRVTFGQFKRRFVYNIKVGDKQVKRVMWNGQQIWPGEEERVRSISLDTSGLDGTVDAKYWIHAINAVAGVSSPNCYVGFRIAERPYCVNSTYNGTALAKFSLGELDFGEDGPLLQDVRVGDELVLTAVIPELEGEGRVIEGYERSFTMEWALPLIGGTRFRIELRNYSRKRSTYGAVTKFCSTPSGTEFKGFSVSKHQGVRMTGKDTVTDAALPLSDTGCTATAYTTGGCYYDPSKGQYQYVYPVWPAFKRVFRFRVTAVTMA